MRVLLATLALLAAGSAAAETAGVGATRLNAVAYHPFPDTVPLDEGGDPFGFAAITRGGRDVDWMAGNYGAYYFPTVRFDGIREEANRPDANAASYLEGYRRHVEARLAEESPIVLRAGGSLAAGSGNLSVRTTAFTNLSEERLLLRVALVEDDVLFAATNGVDVHRMVARARFPDQPIAWTAVGETFVFEVAFSFAVPAGARTEHLGAVAWVQNDRETGRFEPEEILQSATYLFRNAQATVQVTKAVLLEMYTATWCEACVYGDGAMDALLATYGIPTTVEPASPYTYLRPPALRDVALVLLVGLPLAVLLGGRWR